MIVNYEQDTLSLRMMINKIKTIYSPLFVELFLMISKQEIYNLIISIIG